jgi:uncharacterized protein YciI
MALAKFVAMLEYTEDEELRRQTRPAHRDYLQALLAAGKLAMSGPWTDDTGALLIYEVDHLDEAERLLADDPFRAAGVISNARIKEWRVVLDASAAS